MADQRSLLRASIASVALLVTGVLALMLRQEWVRQHWLWSDYRLNVANRASMMARFAAEHKAWPFPPLVAPSPPRAVDFFGYLITPGLTIAMAGVLAFLLIGTGSRRVWPLVALGGLCLGDATIVTTSYADWASWVGVAASLAVVVVAALPLLVATRGRAVVHRRLVPRTTTVVAVLAVLAVDWVWVQQYNGPLEPRPAPTLALVVGAALIAASPMRRRWWPALLVGALAGVPQLQGPFGTLLYLGPSAMLHELPGSLVGPLVSTAAVAVGGALAGLYGARALDGWHALTHHGPEVRMRSRRAVSA